MEKTELRLEWERRIADFQASGLTQMNWCEHHGLKLHQLKYWLKRIQGTKEQAVRTQKKQWVPLELAKESPVSEQNPMQIKVGQATIEVKTGFNADLLADVVKVLGSLC